MAERPSELDDRTTGATSDDAEGVANELGASTTYTTTALGTYPGDAGDRDDEARDLTPVSSDAEYDVATTGDATEVDTTDEPEQIRAQIEQTRNDMSETINAIQDKLSIANITESVKEEVSEQISGAYNSAKTALFDATAGKVGSFMAKVENTVNQISEEYGPAVTDVSRRVVSTARSNPIPFALIGIGVGMLLWNSRYKSNKSRSYRYADGFETENLDYEYSGSERARRDNRTLTNLSETASQAYNKVGDVAGQAYEGVSNVAGSAYSGVSSAATSAYEGLSSAAGTVSNKVGKLGTQTKQAARWTQETYSQQLEQNPLAVGAVALALGALVGLALPSTELEGQYMGEYRENLLQKASEAAGDVIEKVQQVAGEVTKNVQETMQESVQGEAKAQGTA